MIPYWGAFFNGSLWEVFVAGFFVPVIQENCWNTKRLVTNTSHISAVRFLFFGEVKRYMLSRQLFSLNFT